MGCQRTARPGQVTVSEGWVTLTGEVDWQYQKLDAEQAVRRLTGVRGMTNHITVKSRIAPADLKKRIEDALVRSAELEHSGLASGSTALRSSLTLSPARTLAAALGAEIVLVRVVPTGEARLSVLNSPEVDRAHDDLEAVAAPLRSSAVQTELVVSQGDPADTIVAEVQSHGADLVVMSTHAPNSRVRLAIRR
jgi:nucleotide-binding universal stress UspA family protein